MAEKLQEDFSLPVVKVRLGDLEGSPIADIRLVVNREGKQRTLAHQAFQLDHFGFVETTARKDPELRVPSEVSHWIAEWAHEQLGPHDVLWLHLVKPYGALGAVPWERDIQPGVQVPFLRLPDALPEPDRSTSTFHLALCATAPSEEGPSTAAKMGPDVARSLAAGIGDRLRLHVFADLEAHGLLQSQLANLAIGEVRIYQPDPEFDGSTSSPSRSGLRNGWLRWIRHATKGQSLDAVHFITHGYTLGYDGAILTTQSPSSPDRRSPQSVQSGELRTFLTQVGAIVAGFTRPIGNYSDYGLRRLVDELGSMRAGPVILHDPELDPQMVGLRDGFAFLSSGGPARPPDHPSITLFAQPRQVANINLQELPDPVAYELLGSSSAVKESFSRDDTPVWLSAAERYIEENKADLIRFEQAKQVRSPTKSEEAYYAGVEQALYKIRDVVDRYAQDRL